MRKFAICVLFVAAMSSGQDSGKNQSVKSTAVSSERACGRYQIFFGTHARADQYLVDTYTGRTWQKTQYSDLVGEPEVWMPLQRIDNDAELNEWIKKQTLKAKPEEK
jgi:hypothetical protein